MTETATLLQDPSIVLDFFMSGRHPGQGTYVPTEIESLIEDSKSILELKDDWDGEGTPGIARDTWSRATSFLRRHAEQIYVRDRRVIPMPLITPADSGSIDLYWKTLKFEMLINFPKNPDDPAEFYADDYGKNVTKGTLSPHKLSLAILEWL